MIYYLIISLPIAGLFIALLDRIFPQQFMFILTEISFNALYLYSNLEIYFTRVNRNINDFIESNHTLLKIKNKLNYFKTYKNEDKNDPLTDKQISQIVQDKIGNKFSDKSVKKLRGKLNIPGRPTRRRNYNNES